MAYKISPYVSDQIHKKYTFKGKVKRAVKRIVFNLLTDEAKLEQGICWPEDIRLHTRSFCQDLRGSKESLRKDIEGAIGVELGRADTWTRVYRIYNSIERAQDEQNTKES